jgi:hypothetical protein
VPQSWVAGVAGAIEKTNSARWLPAQIFGGQRRRAPACRRSKARQGAACCQGRLSIRCLHQPLTGAAYLVVRRRSPPPRRCRAPVRFPAARLQAQRGKVHSAALQPGFGLEAELAEARRLLADAAAAARRAQRQLDGASPPPPRSRPQPPSPSDLSRCLLHGCCWLQIPWPLGLPALGFPNLLLSTVAACPCGRRRRAQ